MVLPLMHPSQRSLGIYEFRNRRGGLSKLAMWRDGSMEANGVGHPLAPESSPAIGIGQPGGGMMF